MAAGRKGIIYVDSDSEDEETQPKLIHSRRSKRLGRQNADTLKKQKSSKRLRNSPIVIDDEYGSIPESDSLLTTLPLSSEELRSNVLSVSATDNNAGPLRTTEATDVLTIEDDIPADSHPRKTAKRGLARKHCEPKTNDSTSLTKHKVSVYSQAIAEGFKSLIHGVGLGGAEAAVDDAENILTETKEIDTELPSTNMGSNLAETQEVFSQQDQIDLEGDDDGMVNYIKIQSPSPPPQLDARPARRMNKKLIKAFNALSKAKNFLDSTTPPSKRSKRKDSDVIIVGEEHSINQDVVVKVRYLTKVHRFQMKLNEPFHILTNKLSKEINADEHSLGLFLHDRSLKVTETPQSIKLSVADIIECHCIKVSENSVSSSDAIELVIQCSNSRNKTTLIANKRRPLSDIMQKYAQLMNDAVGSFVFSFDGEDIEPSDTPSKLEMEDHDVIDVVHN